MEFEDWWNKNNEKYMLQFVEQNAFSLRGIAFDAFRAGSEAEAIKAWNTRADKYLSQLRNLLAVIHRDGGHYTEEHGLEKSQMDAIKKVADLIHAKL